MKPRILLTGATGYIGGRLLRLLEAEGRPVRCLTRRPEFLQGRIAPESEVVAGDVLDADSLQQAMNGVHAAYYLVHSMGAAHDFEETDRQAAERFGTAARTQGVQRIIYLGGVRFGNRLIDSRRVRVATLPPAAFAPIQRIGGATGWYYGDWLWRIRGWLDMRVGGVGLRRGRRDSEQLKVGDTLDCWRVEVFEPGRTLRLAAEMK